MAGVGSRSSAKARAAALAALSPDLAGVDAPAHEAGDTTGRSLPHAGPAADPSSASPAPSPAARGRPSGADRARGKVVPGARRSRHRVMRDALEHAELAADAERLHRGSHRAPITEAEAQPPAAPVAVQVAQARRARRVSPKPDAAGGGPLGGQAAEPRALLHPGNLARPSPRTRLFGKGQATLHRPGGDHENTGGVVIS